MIEKQKYLIWVAVAVLGLAVMHFNRSQRDDELIGTWKVERSQTNGTPPHRGRAFWVIGPGKLVVVQDEIVQHFDLTIDPSATPKHFNATMGIASDGIYEVNDQTLRVSQSSLATERPTEFVTRFGDLATVTELSRIEFDDNPSFAGLQAKLSEVFGPAKNYSEPMESDQSAEEFVSEIVGRVLQFGPASKHLRLMSRVSWMETEINNGGFHQFFFNSSGETALQVIDDLNMIGATETAKLVQVGCALFPNGEPEQDLGKRRAQLEEFTLDDHEVLRDLENQFYARREDLNVLLKRYWEEQER